MIKIMSVNELKAKLDNKEEIVLIDCREQNEWDAGYIDGAILMPKSTIVETYTDLKDKDAEIIVQCRSGKRSMDVCQFLKDEGYTNLTNLEGGILAWMEVGNDIVTPNE